MNSTDRDGMIYVAILGCGMMGQEHASYMMANPRMVLKYIVDTSDESIKALMKVVAGEQSPIRVTEEELMNRIYDIDLLVIATPNYLHTPALLRWGLFPITILVEKPVAVSLEQVQALRKAQSQAGFQANIWVAMEYRYIPAIQKLIQMIPKIGPLKAVTIRENRYPFLSKVDEWNKDRNKSGDTLVEKCCHFFDLFRLLTRQEMSSCSTKIQRGLLKNYGYDTSKDIPIIDSAYVLLDFEHRNENDEDVGMRQCASTDSEHSTPPNPPPRPVSPALYERSMYEQELRVRLDSRDSLGLSLHSTESVDLGKPHADPIAIPVRGPSGGTNRSRSSSGSNMNTSRSNGPTASSSPGGSYGDAPVSPAMYERSVYEHERRDRLDSAESINSNQHPLHQWQTQQHAQQQARASRQRLDSHDSLELSSHSYDHGRERELSMYEQERDEETTTANFHDDQDGEAINALSALTVSVNELGQQVQTLMAGLTDAPLPPTDTPPPPPLQQATIGCLELCMFAEGSRHQEEIVVTGMLGRLEAYLPENKVFYYRRPDDTAWSDKSKPPPAGMYLFLLPCSLPPFLLPPYRGLYCLYSLLSLYLLINII